MTLFRLAIAYLGDRALNTALNVLLFAIGVATVVVLVLIGGHMEERMSREARGVNMVIGHKGSPLQLILSTIFHADVPTGNIPLSAAAKFRDHPLVAEAVPLALGDSYRGFRIVGTEPAYIDFFKARLADGRLWNAPMEAVVGADVVRRTGIGTGAHFEGSHGLGESGGAHHEEEYRVVGILAPTGTVVDRLILTAVESVWEVHEEHHDDDHAEGVEPDDHAHEYEHEAEKAEEEGREITALLIRYRSPLAAATLPREVNAEPGLQAASPAFETARLLSLVGIGMDVMRAFGILLVGAAALGVMIALYTAMEERRYDLAIMRTLGGSRAKVTSLVVLQALFVSAAGLALGLGLGHGLVEAAARLVPMIGATGLTGLVLRPAEGVIILLALAAGLLAAVVPAVRVFRADAAMILKGN